MAQFRPAFVTGHVLLTFCSDQASGDEEETEKWARWEAARKAQQEENAAASETRQRASSDMELSGTRCGPGLYAQG